jgi:hypothetical protein
MQEFNFKKPLLALDGKSKTELSLSQCLQTSIGNQTKGNVLKLYGWLQCLQKSDILLLDEADRLALISLIENDDKMFMFAKGQLMELLSKK